MGKMNLNVQINSGSGLGGVYPFVVVCFDNDLTNELFKTGAANGGQTCNWNESFPIDLTSHLKNLTADGKPEPTYLTFFVFDTGVPGLPSLGSAGVLLSTVRDHGVAKGDFPIVNGKGTLSIVVENDKKGWIHSDAAKIAGVAGAVGVAGLAAGLTAMAINNNKKKKNQTPEEAAAAEAAEAAAGKKKKKGFSIPGLSRLRGGGDDDDDEEEEEEEEEEEPLQPQHGTTRSGEASRGIQGPPGSRPWWDPESTDEDGDPPPAHTPPRERPQARFENVPESAHIEEPTDHESEGVSV